MGSMPFVLGSCTNTVGGGWWFCPSWRHFRILMATSCCRSVGPWPPTDHRTAVWCHSTMVQTETAASRRCREPGEHTQKKNIQTLQYNQVGWQEASKKYAIPECKPKPADQLHYLRELVYPAWDWSCGGDCQKSLSILPRENTDMVQNQTLTPFCRLF